MSSAAISSRPLTDAHLAVVAGHVARYLEGSKASNTIEAYRSDWSRFAQWCVLYGKTALPASPETVSLYLSDLSRTLKSSTVTRHAASICHAHRSAGYQSPTRDLHVRMVLAGIKRQNGTERKSKKALLVPELKKIVKEIPDDLLGLRDRALLLCGFCAALRRSELVALDREDAEFTSEGLVLRIRRSKSDQFGSGRQVGIPYTSSPDTCAVRSLQRWIQASGISHGPLFRRVTRYRTVLPRRLTSHAVAKIVKHWADVTGLDASQLSAHSLRSGLATAAAMSGASERKIMDQTRHKSLIQVRRYIQSASLFTDNPVAGLDL